MFWASSDNTGIILKTTQMAGRCWGGFNKVRHVLNTSGGIGKVAGIRGYGKRGRGVKIFHSMLK